VGAAREALERAGSNRRRKKKRPWAGGPIAFDVRNVSVPFSLAQGHNTVGPYSFLTNHFLDWCSLCVPKHTRNPYVRNYPHPGPHRLFQARPWQAEQINKRRSDAARCIAKHQWEADGTQVHIGNQVQPEQVCAAMVVAAWVSTPESAVNLKVMLDGADNYWVTSTSVEDERTDKDGKSPYAITGCPTRSGRREAPDPEQEPGKAARVHVG